MKERRISRKKIIIFYASVAALTLICAFRLYHSFANNMLVDFMLGYDCTGTGLRGDGFFNLEKLTTYDWKNQPFILPGTLLYCILFAYMPLYLAKLIFYLLSVVASIGCFIYLYKLSGKLKSINFRTPGLDAAVFFGAAFVFLNSSPLLQSLRHGQVSVWFLLFLLFYLGSGNVYLKSFLFGAATLFKYSMVTIFAPLLLVKRQYKVCILGFIFFVLACLWPVLLGYDVVSVYSEYFTALINSIGKGFNTFSASGYNMLQFDFFCNKYINHAGKLVLGIFILFIYWKERKNKELGDNLLLLVFSLTMLISYHRLYDNVPAMLLLTVKCYSFIAKKDWINSLICGGFIGFYLIPLSIVYKITDLIGSKMQFLSGIIHFSKYGQYQNILPILVLVQIALTVYAAYLYFKKENDWKLRLD